MTTERDPPMRCAVCQEGVPEGGAHYRLLDARVHIECLRAFWRTTSPNVMPPSRVPPTPPTAPPSTR
jgi:hypothetical protein